MCCGPPASAPLLMHVHIVYLGWGGGRGQGAHSSTGASTEQRLPWLPHGCGVAESRPTGSPRVPILRSCLGGLPVLLSCQRDLRLSTLRLLQAESEGQRSGDGVVCRLMCGQEATRMRRLGWEASEYPIQSDTVLSFC